jgi:hypothetical protein
MERQTNLQKLLAVLADGRWHSADELAYKVSFRFGHTIFEAREKDYPVEKRKISHNRYEYRMASA